MKVWRARAKRVGWRENSHPGAISPLPCGSRGGLGWGCLCFSTQQNLSQIRITTTSASHGSLRSHPTPTLPCKQGRERIFATFAVASFLAFANAAHADTTADDLRTAAEQAVRAQYGTAGSRVVIVPTRLNPRLHFAACPHALQTRLPMRQGIPSRVAVAVSCPGAPGWSIQVPVQMQVF